MKIKLITLENLKGEEVSIPNLLSIRFELNEDPEDWIDVIGYANGIQIRSSPVLHIFPQASNAISIFTTHKTV